MKKICVFILILSLLLLCACGAEAPSPAPSVEPTPAPPTEMVLDGESADEILELAGYDHLRHIDAAASTEYDALLQLSELLPECDIIWNYEFDGVSYPSDTKELTITSTENGLDVLRFLPELTRVDMSACELSTEEMEELSTRYPGIDFLWTIRFGKWEVRNDITCFSTLCTGTDGSHRYSTEELYPLLRFCHKLRALDLGHNDLTDISLLADMPELQVLILADNPNLADISALSGLTELHYIELFLCWDIEDFSPLYELTKMEDLNLSYCRNLDDLGFIDNMPDFKNGWFRSTKIDRDDVSPYAEARPEMTFIYGCPQDISAICCGWRSTDRNTAIRRAFTNWRDVVEYRHWDDVEYR